MGLFEMIFILAIVGVILYLVTRFVPMDAKIKTLIIWATVIICILWVVNQMGIFGHFHDINVRQ